jgi:PAS domain S-box-containing protein
MQRTSSRILVVVPDAADRSRLGDELAGAGIAATLLASADRALEVLAKERFELVLLDVGGEPDELATVGAAVERSHALLVCCHESGADGAAALAMRLGARELLARPFRSGGEPLARLRRWLHHRSSHGIPDPVEDLRRLRLQHEDLRRHLVEQVQSFEETQETFYLDLSRMMTIIGNIMDGIVFADQNGNVALMNPVAEDLLGIKSFIAIGKPIVELSGRDELVEAMQADHRAAIDKREISRTIEVHHSQQDLLYIKVHTTKVLDYRGNFAGVLTVLQDVTAEFKSDQLKNQYLSIVAHELRTPLTGIKTFSTILAKGVLGVLNGRQLEVVDSIREQSIRLEHQIDKLINLGQLDSGDFGADLEEFEAREFLATAMLPFEQAAKDRSIELVCRNLEQPVKIRADRTDLKRALQALIENAVKFTPDYGNVEVSATLQGDPATHVCFAVRDSGIGIDPRYHRRIFEKFFQVEDPLTRHHGGAGLGLFVAQGIIEAHGSRIEVASELTHGAEFSFSIPVAEAPETVAGAPGGRAGWSTDGEQSR